MARPKAKPIGTDNNTAAPSSSTKKITRFQLPMPFNAGAPSFIATASKTATAMPNSASRHESRANRANAVTAISSAPTGMAMARNVLWMPRAGVSMNHSSAA